MAVGDLIIPEGFGQSTTKWAVEGRTNPVSVTLGYTPATTSSDASAHAEEIYQAWKVTGGPCVAAAMGTQFILLSTDTVYNASGTFLGGSSSSGAVAGSDGMDSPLIVGNSWLVQKRTGVVGRSHRGRFYFPFMQNPESSVDLNGNILGSVITAMQTKFTNMFTQLGAGAIGIIPNVLHHVPKTGTAPDPTPILSFLVTTKVGTQRRRLR